MPDFIVLPPLNESSSHYLIRRFATHTFNNPQEFDFDDFSSLKTLNENPVVNWFASNDLGLRLLGDGINNGCDTYLVLGRPGGKLLEQIELKMSAEIDTEIPVQFLKNNPKVVTVFYGSIIAPQISGSISNMDILKNSSWMAKMDGAVVECHDPSIRYEGASLNIFEYLTLSEFGTNGAYLITGNPEILNHNGNVGGRCSKTGSNYVMLSTSARFKRQNIKMPKFSSNCTAMPNKMLPTHILVDGDSFELEIFDVLKTSYGITTGPDIKVISNIPYTDNGDKLIFDFSGKDYGVINLEFQLGKSSLLQSLGPDFHQNQIITIVRK